MENQKHTETGFTQRLSRIIEDNLNNEKFGVSELARELRMSRSNLHRKIKAVSGDSVSVYIRKIRLNKALELLHDDYHSISEVAYQVGFGSPNYFRKCFHEQFGVSPKEYRENPESGISKDPQGYKSSEKQIKSKRPILTWTYSLLALVVVVTVLWFIVKSFQDGFVTSDNSIIVLPFQNDSPGKGDDYIINGLMDEILNNLSLIENLDVVSRTTSEKYRNSQRSSREIANELGVRYILEGSAQTIFDSTRVRLQLIEAKRDRHLWAKPYERMIRLENLFDVQEELSMAVAEELKIVLKLHERDGIKKIPTENLAAYKLYLHASVLLLDAEYMTGEEMREAVNEAFRLFNQAVGLDPIFAEAYLALGGICIKHYFKWWVSSDVERAYAQLETGLSFVEKALLHDPGNRGALRFKGLYYQKIGNHQKAEEFIEASYNHRTRSYGDLEWETINYLEYDNFYPGIRSYLEYLKLKPKNTNVLPEILHEVYRAFMGTGFFELARQQAENHLALTGDYDQYYWRMSMLERWQGQHQNAQQYTLERGKLDNTNIAWLRWSLTNYIYMSEFDSAYKYMHLVEAERHIEGEELLPDFAYGWIYLERGMDEEAEYHLEGFIEMHKKNLAMKTPNSQKGYTHLLLSIGYSILGDAPNTLKHIEYLKDASALDIGWIYDLKYLTSFDFVRSTPEFQDVLKHMERTLMKEQKKIARLLRREDFPPA